MTVVTIIDSSAIHTFDASNAILKTANGIRNDSLIHSYTTSFLNEMDLQENTNPIMTLSIKNALQEHRKGNSTQLREISHRVSLLSRSRTIPEEDIIPLLNSSLIHMIHDWLKELCNSCCILSISRNSVSADTIEAFINIDWTILDESFSQSFIDFACNLVSSNPNHLYLCLHVLVQSLQYRELDKISLPIKTLMSQVDQDIIHIRVRNCISSIVRLIPSAPVVLIPLLRDYFPHKSTSHQIQETYLRNLTQLALQIPSLRPSILDLSIEKIIQIDVEIQIEVDDLEELELEHIQQSTLAMNPSSYTSNHDMFSQSYPSPKLSSPAPRRLKPDFQMFSESNEDNVSFHENSNNDDDIDIHSGDDYDGYEKNCSDNDDNGIANNSPISIPEVIEERRSVTAVKELIEKIDGLMLILFKYIDQVFSNDTDETHEKIFMELLSTFERIILPTLKCRYIQFLLFYISSKQPSTFPDHFLGVIMVKLFGEEFVKSQSNPIDKSTDILRSYNPPLPGFDAIRLVCTSYIGSYVARAKFLDPSIIRTCIQLLLSWCDTYLLYYHHITIDWNSIHRHSVLYSITRSIFYIFCFRHTEIFQSSDAIYINRLGTTLERLLYSKFQPLSMCPAHIAQEFANICQHYEFLYCKSLLKSNNGYKSYSPFTCKTPTHTPQPSIDGTVQCYSNQDSILSTISVALQIEELDSFFPFDPYKLKSSCHHISSDIYLEWTDIDHIQDDDLEMEL